MSDTHASTPLLSLPLATLTALHDVLRREQGPEGAAAVARQVGFQSGEAFLAALEERVGAGGVEGLPADEFWGRLAEFFQHSGWGPLDVESLHPAILSLSSPGWAEAEGRRTEQPSCHLTTGLLADLLSRVARSDLAVLEVECRATGEDRCRFLIGNLEALQQVFEGLQAGHGYRDAVAALA